jgi:hypothetical protein
MGPTVTPSGRLKRMPTDPSVPRASVTLRTEPGCMAQSSLLPRACISTLTAVVFCNSVVIALKREKNKIV